MADYTGFVSKQQAVNFVLFFASWFRVELNRRFLLLRVELSCAIAY